MFERLTRMFSRKRREEAHRVALERLHRDAVVTAEYMRSRVDEGLTDTFDAWDAHSEDLPAEDERTGDESTADEPAEDAAPVRDAEAS